MLFVVVEGADAVGKATLVKGLVSHLDQSHTVRTFSFPQYDTPVGKIIKQHLTEELHHVLGTSLAEPDMFMKAEKESPYILQSLMIADKCDAAMTIQRHLLNGNAVICDRYWQSGYVYGICDGLPADWLWRTQHHLPMADINILLDLPTGESAKRRPQFRDRYERDREKQEKVRQEYLKLWDVTHPIPSSLESQNDINLWTVIDAQQSAADVLSQALQIVDEKMLELY